MAPPFFSNLTLGVFLCLSLTVEDTGIGMHPVDMLHGTVEVTSMPSHGSRFRVLLHLPWIENLGADGRRSSTGPAIPSIAGLRVLLADSLDSSRLLIHR